MSCLLANIRTPACLRSYSKRKKEKRNRDKAVHSCNWRASLLTIRQLCFFQFTEEVPVSLNEMIMSMQRQSFIIYNLVISYCIILVGMGLTSMSGTT